MFSTSKCFNLAFGIKYPPKNLNLLIESADNVRSVRTGPRMALAHIVVLLLLS